MHGPRSARRRRSLLGFGQLAPTGPSAERPGRLCPVAFRPDVLASPGATDRACRYIHTDDDDTGTPADPLPVRRCLACNRELPANSRPERKFCSSACRGRHWNAANPGPAWYKAQEPRVRLHWHLGGSTFLAGDYRAGYGRGPEGCPPECPGIKPPNTSSEAGSRRPRRLIATQGRLGGGGWLPLVAESPRQREISGPDSRCRRSGREIDRAPVVSRTIS